jgi:hypothetical protein
MRPAGLALERAPPIAVPLRFFLTAPVFLVAAGAVLIWSGPEALTSRASPAALAAAHFVTLGFMTMVMAGAMLQMLPVLAGAAVPRVGGVAALVHAGLTLGTAALGAGFLLGRPLLLKVAAWLLGATILVLVLAAAAALTRAAVRNATTRGMSLGVAGLVVTVALGLVLAATYAWGVPLANLAVRALHPAWGILGWAGLLVAAVAFQVVPMFQMTPRYPDAMTSWFTAAAFAVLIAWSLAAWYASGSPVERVLGLARRGTRCSPARRSCCSGAGAAACGTRRPRSGSSGWRAPRWRAPRGRCASLRRASSLRSKSRSASSRSPGSRCR